MGGGRDLAADAYDRRSGLPTSTLTDNYQVLESDEVTILPFVAEGGEVSLRQLALKSKVTL